MTGSNLAPSDRVGKPTGWGNGGAADPLGRAWTAGIDREAILPRRAPRIGNAFYPGDRPIFHDRWNRSDLPDQHQLRDRYS